MGLVFNDATITTVGEAQEFFGEAAIVWEQWDEDRTCAHSPRVGYGPHAPQPSDCLCLVDIMATARRAGFDYHDLDSEGYYWASITPRVLPQPPPWFLPTLWFTLGVGLGFAACLGLISLVAHLDTYRERASFEIATTGRFGIPKPVRKNPRGDVRVLLYLYSCPDLPPTIGACGSDVSETSY